MSAAQSHFIDICALVDHPPPTDADPKGLFFTFEVSAEKPRGRYGRADAWYKGKFIWEYKRPGSDLDKAYDQLSLYRESLGNPPLLITSDIHKIIIHTNFTNTAKRIYTIDFDRLLDKDGLNLLKHAFYDPGLLKPDETQEQVTQATADTFIEVANTLQQWTRFHGSGEYSERLSHFIIRLLFSLFAEDMGLLPDNLFTKMVDRYRAGTTSQLSDFVDSLSHLFTAMRNGGLFGIYRIKHFNGGLFDDDFVPDLPSDIIYALRKACIQDWANIDPSIFGTLFERIIDESKKSQLGLHYTSKNDIMLVIEPVLMQPLRKDWAFVKQQVRTALHNGNTEKAYVSLVNLSDRIASLRVLDPACGSGNFLYLALQQLLDLQKDVITFSVRSGLPEIPLTVSPSQLYGIEINPYAYELAQITVWIGYLQWCFENGFREISEPILRPLKNIQRRDAILSFDNNNPVEPEWPEADVIIGNPPFLGSRKMRPELGEDYCDALQKIHHDRIEGLPDLVCYWFEKAQSLIAQKKVLRAGLLATQAIRGGANRQVLEHIKRTGDIFLAWSDREWILDGATVHVSIVGFDTGEERTKNLNGHVVESINSDLTSGVDLTSVQQLRENDAISFQGVILRGPFDISQKEAKDILASIDNPNGQSNSDVIKIRRTGKDVVQKCSDSFVIDFGIDMSIERASQYLLPFEYVRKNVLPMREETKQAAATATWWLHWNTRPEMRRALAKLKRYIATPRVAKHRVFVWLDSSILPDAQLVVFARSDDYFFGVLHSRPHEIWARRVGTQLRDAESGFRYTSTTTFQTFPFPWPPGEEPSENDNSSLRDIASASRNLNEFRNLWSYPDGVGITFSARLAQKRTLSNLYNALDNYRETVKGKTHNPVKWKKEVDSIISLDEIEELDHLHNELDSAVASAYGWPDTLNDEEMLDRLRGLNINRLKKS